MPEGYTFHGPCRRPKGKFIIRPTDSVGGYKGRASYLCCALKLRWSGQAGGYVATASKLRKFEQLYRDGWDATAFGELVAPKGVAA